MRTLSPAGGRHRDLRATCGRAEGNAFFLGELLRTLEDEAALRRRRGWALGDLAAVQVPALLRQVIDGRLAGSARGAGAPLVAAVIGQTSRRCVGVRGGERGRPARHPSSRRRRAPSGRDGGRDGVRFAHALIREALYEDACRCAACAPSAGGEALAALPRRPGRGRLPLPARGRRAGSADGSRGRVAGAPGRRVPDGDRAIRGGARAVAADGHADTRWLLYRIGRMRVQERYLPYFTEALRLAEEIGDRPSPLRCGTGADCSASGWEKGGRDLRN